MYAFLKQIHFGTSLFYEPFSSEELNRILKKLKTSKQVQKEIDRVQKILTELEKPDYKVILMPADCRQCISKFSQLFRALLIRRDFLLANQPESDSESTITSDDSSTSSLEEIIEIIV